MEPKYAFSIPSVEDDIPLDSRIYHPGNLAIGTEPVRDATFGKKGAIIAHPYAPLGGCSDDHVVLALTETLLGQGYIVGTFNFRGAGDSAGRTTWTGKAELQDFVSFAGFMIYYLRHIGPDHTLPTSNGHPGQTRLVLAGYSYGSLILARFPPTSDIVTRFESAEVGTAAAEIILRARTLAKQTLQALEEQQSPVSPRGRSLKPHTPTSPSKRASPITVGGEETDPSDRRRSRDSRRSVDVIRKSVEVPHRIKERIKHRHVSRETSDVEDVSKNTIPSASQYGAPQVATSYLFVSPVLMPFSSTLLSPGAPTAALNVRKGDASSPKQYLYHRTLVAFGSNDAFTSSKRLKQWAEKQSQDSKGSLSWCEIDGAGHFWNEAGVLQALQQKVASWTAESAGHHEGR